MADDNKPITLSFSKKNVDVRNILNDIANKTGQKKTEYICEAVRFYYHNKDKCSTGIEKDEIEELVENMLEEKLKLILNNKNFKNNDNVFNELLIDTSDINEDDLAED